MADPREELQALRRLAELEAKDGGVSAVPVEEESLFSKLLDPNRWPTRPEVRERAIDIGMGLGPASLVTGASKALFSSGMQSGAKKLMQSALKPAPSTQETGEAARAIDTMLREGINPTTGGVEKLKTTIGQLNKQISEMIKSSSETITTGKPGTALLDVLNRMERELSSPEDVAKVTKIWAIYRNHPLIRGKLEIPLSDAQKLKQGLYRSVDGKYGELGSAEVEARKGLARGLKENIAEKAPEVTQLNRRESDLLNALNLVERRAFLDLNKNPASFAWLAHSPATFAAYMADKSALFKSLVARAMNKGKETIPVTAVGTATGLGFAAGPTQNE